MSPTKHEYLYGFQPVFQALTHQKRILHKLFVKEGNLQTATRLEEILRLAKNLGLPIEWVSKHQLNQLCSNTLHQGVILQCEALPFSTLHLDSFIGSAPQPIFLALDQVEDPHNIGAIIRTCGFFNLPAIILSQSHFSIISPTISKTSTGVAEFLPIIVAKNMARYLEQQQKKGYWIVGLDHEATTSIATLERDRPIIVVLGNEGKGIRHLVKSKCDWLVKIEGNSTVSSLNVSNASAIALYQLTHS